MRNLNSLIEAQRRHWMLQTKSDLLAEFNKDIFTETIQVPNHVHISDKVLIQTEKYLKDLRSKYEVAKKALEDKTFFTQEVDQNIEMIDEDEIDEDEDQSIDSLDDNLYSDEDKAEQL